jgi:alkylhydroperoxidase family enzyme
MDGRRKSYRLPLPKSIAPEGHHIAAPHFSLYGGRHDAGKTGPDTRTKRRMAMARFKYLDKEDLAPADRPLLRDINLTRLLFHSPGMARASNAGAMYIRNESKLDPRLREMAIIQVGYLARSVYEYAHHVKIGLDFGVSEADLRAIADDTAGKPTTLDALTKAVLKAARELTDEVDLSDTTFAVLRAHLDDERLIDLLHAICSYNGTIRMLAALRIDLEDEYAPYLARFPLPKD